MAFLYRFPREPKRLSLAAFTKDVKFVLFNRRFPDAVGGKKFGTYSGECPRGARQTIPDIQKKDDSVDPIDHFDIMIVGAGPAGISTWLHLKKYAPELADHVLVIDKAVFPRPKVCAGGVGAWSQSVLNHLEIDLTIPSLFVDDVAFQYRDQQWIFHSPNQFRMVQRADFDLALVRSAMKRGMVFHENEQFMAAEGQQETLEVKTNRGNYVVKALVGADGSLSMVRRSMIGSPHACLASTLQVSAPLDLQFEKGHNQARARIDLSPIDDGLQGYLWHFPCLNNGTPCMNLGLGSSRFLSGRPKADIKKIFCRELHAHQIEIRPEAWSSHPIRWFSHDVPIACPNVILAGDAAGIEPAFGGGIHMALSYGEIAAQELIQAFQTHDFSFRQYKEGLMSHQLGQYIRDYILLAKKIYSGKGNPLEQVRQFYTDRFIRRKLQSLLMGNKHLG